MQELKIKSIKLIPVLQAANVHAYIHTITIQHTYTHTKYMKQQLIQRYKYANTLIIISEAHWYAGW